jgi:myo-inositol-hexaphosphate 3-phosphohydrolase
VTQFELLDADLDGELEGMPVRSFSVGSESEGCVADDDTGALYLSEENVALWRYSAEPDGGTTREAVDVLAAAGGHLVNDIEGVTLVDQPDGAGFVIVSVQNAPDPDASYFSVYRRGAGNDFVKTFRVADGTSSDDCDRTDGVVAVAADLGPAFPRGIFVCQDNNNDPPGTTGNQDFKLVRLDRVVDRAGRGDHPCDHGRHRLRTGHQPADRRRHLPDRGGASANRWSGSDRRRLLEHRHHLDRAARSSGVSPSLTVLRRGPERIPAWHR